MSDLNNGQTPAPDLSPLEEDILTFIAGRERQSTRITHVMVRMAKRGLLSVRKCIKEPEGGSGKRQHKSHYAITALGIRALEEANLRYRLRRRLREPRRVLQPDIPDDLLYRLFRVAKGRGMRMTLFINEILEQYIAELESPKAALSRSGETTVS